LWDAERVNKPTQIYQNITDSLTVPFQQEVTLAGLALNAAFGLWWAYPAAALVIAVFLVREAREAWEGDDYDKA
jgi:divalent metal cation (Fe/Co/Zn/Cd) transporter